MVNQEGHKGKNRRHEIAQHSENRRQRQAPSTDNATPESTSKPEPELMEAERKWLTENPLKEGFNHIAFTSTTHGHIRLWQKFLTPDGEIKSRRVGLRRCKVASIDPAVNANIGKESGRMPGVLKEIEARLTDAERDWLTINPLKEGFSHNGFTRMASGNKRLRQRFLTPNGEEKSRLVGVRRFKKVNMDTAADSNTGNSSEGELLDAASSDKQEDEYQRTQQSDSLSNQPCTLDWCQKQGRRPTREYSMSRATFKKHCDQLCLDWHCKSCGTGRTSVQLSDGKIMNRCLITNLCLECEKRDTNSEAIEEDAKIQYALQTGRIRPATRYLMDAIEERAQTLPSGLQRTTILNSLRQIKQLEKHLHEIDQWYDDRENHDDGEHSFEIVGTSDFAPEDRECRICREKGCTLLSENRTILACEECAKAWTEYIGSTKWERILQTQSGVEVSHIKRRRARRRKALASVPIV